MDLVCPKCQGTMRTYERNGVHVDQCTECRGIFLDRGELERLVDAENAWHGGPAAQPASQQSTHQPAHQQPGLQQPAASLGSVVSEVLGQVRSSSSSSHGYGHKPKKQKSLISELFG
ncbi:zf-TFIIB domain-containing protein [Modestobacter altitudinis]|uniref:TFIIB-type zinc ribbon-containing protein n=1 Tax=Modestobacter altitudinis TaxID=2213158 RepID=UPI00110CCA48